mmetsp:Transcript_127168/g.365752  ORF Transcript_127168/g.365752 Transcript_127168/m.365752 type:complete len:273 (+) Transcript_127168:1417-2235(+)
MAVCRGHRPWRRRMCKLAGQARRGEAPQDAAGAAPRGGQDVHGHDHKPPARGPPGGALRLPRQPASPTSAGAGGARTPAPQPGALGDGDGAARRPCLGREGGHPVIPRHNRPGNLRRRHGHRCRRQQRAVRLRRRRRGPWRRRWRRRQLSARRRRLSAVPHFSPQQRQRVHRRRRQAAGRRHQGQGQHDVRRDVRAEPRHERLAEAEVAARSHGLLGQDRCECGELVTPAAGVRNLGAPHHEVPAAGWLFVLRREARRLQDVHARIPPQRPP